MSAHTPGPWRVVAGANPNDKGIHDVSFGHYGVTFAKVSFAHEYSHMPEYGAKMAAEYANLVSAAPTLLAELHKAADTFRDLARVLSLLGREASAAACRIAEESHRAVIAKAEGA